MAADSRFSQKYWYALSIFKISVGGNLSTDSPVRRQKLFQSALRKFQRFTGSLWAGTLSHGAIMREARCCDRGNFPITRLSDIVLANTREGQVRVGVDVPSVRGETGCFLYGHTAARGFWMLPRSPGSHRQKIFFCRPI